MRTNIEAICAAVVLGLASGGAYGCSCSVREGGLWGSSSPIIFHAKILATQLTSEKKDLGEVVTARFEIVETFRGHPSSIPLLRTISRTSYGTCGILLSAGDEFIIHTDEEGWALECSGTQAYHASRDKNLVTKLRKARDQK